MRGEELLANWFGWANRALEATADPDEVPWAWKLYAFRGYLALPEGRPPAARAAPAAGDLLQPHAVGPEAGLDGRAGAWAGISAGERGASRRKLHHQRKRAPALARVPGARSYPRAVRVPIRDTFRGRPEGVGSLMHRIGCIREPTPSAGFAEVFTKRARFVHQGARDRGTTTRAPTTTDSFPSVMQLNAAHRRQR